MSAEKHAFRYFLAVYLGSTLFLLTLGGIYYYKLNYAGIIDRAVLRMQNGISSFIDENMHTHFIRTGAKPHFGAHTLDVYVNRKRLTGNLYLDNVPFDAVTWYVEDKLCYRYHTRRRWGEIDFVACQDIAPQVRSLQMRTAVFALLSLLFLIFVARILGKIFLRPMQRALTRMEHFITDATHEIHTPVSNIAANIELFKALHPQFADNDELRRIDTSAKRISKIFSDLSFVTLKEQTKRDHNTRITADRLLQERIDFFDTMIRQRNLRLHTAITPTVLTMEGEDLIRLIDNLLSNAFKYAPADSTITLTLNHRLLEVVNRGELDNTRTLTQKFVRGNHAEGGFGLGLHIVEKICKHYGYTFSLSHREDRVHATVYFESC